MSPTDLKSMKSSPSFGKTSTRKQAEGALTKIEILQTQVQQLDANVKDLVRQFNEVLGKAFSAINQIQQQFSASSEMLNALIACVGSEQVVAAVKAERLQKSLVRDENIAALTAEKVKKGEFVSEETPRLPTKDAPADCSWVSTQEFVLNEAGEMETTAGTLETVSLASLPESIYKSFEGHAVGDKISITAPTPEGSTKTVDVVLLGIYKQVVVKQEQQPSAPEATAADAAPAADAAAAPTETPTPSTKEEAA